LTFWAKEFLDLLVDLVLEAHVISQRVLDRPQYQVGVAAGWIRGRPASA